MPMLSQFKNVKYSALQKPDLLDSESEEDEVYISQPIKGVTGSRTKHILSVLCVLGVSLMLVGGAVVAYIYWIHTKHQDQQDHNWNVTISNYNTESCVRLLDVDGDGFDDVMFGISNTANLVVAISKQNRNETMEMCREMTGKPKCIAKLIVLNGKNGKQILEIPAIGPIFEINCANLDINLDGKMECLVSGRLAELFAFDPRTGEVFWEGDQSVLVDNWSVFNPLVVPDLNGDGVKDIVIAHGGDPNFPPEVHKRDAGRLLILDGRTGHSMGRVLNLTDSEGEKETYMSPVLHHTMDGSMYVLYGTGGETVGGSLNAISLPDLYKYVTGKDIGTTLLGKGKYIAWNSLDISPEGIMCIYRSTSKGVMVPPVLLDMTEDSVNDILMWSYDGTMTLYNGETLDTIWTRSWLGYESYSTPAPGYYNNDDVLDFMFHVNYGSWPKFNKSMAVIVDGRNGKTLWSMSTSEYQMNSPLVAKTLTGSGNLFVFRTQGYVVDDEKSSLNRRHADHHRNDYEDASEEDSRDSETSAANPDTKYRVNNNNKANTVHKNREFVDDDYEEENSGNKLHSNNPDEMFNNYGIESDEDKSTDTHKHLDTNIHSDNSDFRENNLPINDYFSNKDSVTSSVNSDVGMSNTHIDSSSLNPLKTCDRNVDTVVWTVDREQKLQKIFTLPAKNYFYTIESHHDMGEQTDDGVAKRNKRHGNHHDQVDVSHVHNNGTMCILMIPDERSTGALGDLDKDGGLDLISLFGLNGEKYDEMGGFIESVFEVRVIRTGLKGHVGNWREYLGSLADSVFINGK